MIVTLVSKLQKFSSFRAFCKQTENKKKYLSEIFSNSKFNSDFKVRFEMEEAEPDEFLEKGKVPFFINAVPEMKELVSILKCHICYQLMVG
jgi:hypothetical protein